MITSFFVYRKRNMTKSKTSHHPTYYQALIQLPKKSECDGKCDPVVLFLEKGPTHILFLHFLLIHYSSAYYVFHSTTFSFLPLPQPLPLFFLFFSHFFHYILLALYWFPVLLFPCMAHYVHSFVTQLSHSFHVTEWPFTVDTKKWLRIHWRYSECYSSVTATFISDIDQCTSHTRNYERFHLQDGGSKTTNHRNNWIGGNATASTPVRFLLKNENHLHMKIDYYKRETN